MAQDNTITNYVILKELGKGSFGTCFLVRSLHSNEVAVVKAVPFSQLGSKAQARAIREVHIMKTLKHPNIVKYISSFLEDGTLYIVMEFVAKGDFDKLVQLHRDKHSHIAEAKIWKWASQLVQALKHLHGLQIAHRDLKCLNIFLTANGDAKLGDFGAAKLLNKGPGTSHTGTPLYLAPEQVQRRPYTTKVDVWGLGCFVYTLACLRPPFDAACVTALGKGILSATPKPLPFRYSKRLETFAFRCLEKDPEQRASLEELEAMCSSLHKQRSLHVLLPSLPHKPVDRKARPSLHLLPTPENKAAHPLYKPRNLTKFLSVGGSLFIHKPSTSHRRLEVGVRDLANVRE